MQCGKVGKSWQKNICLSGAYIGVRSNLGNMSYTSRKGSPERSEGL